MIMLASTFDLVSHEKCKCHEGSKCMYEGFLCSEKYDGYRAFYSAKDKKFLSRNEKEFNVPKFFFDDFPDMDLDGELWINRESFEKMGIVRSKTMDEKRWKESGIKYVVFDAPYVSGTFLERLSVLKSIVAKNIVIAEQEPIKNIEEVFEKLKIVRDKKGEGLMIRNPNSKYEFGKRSKTILKIKPFSDAEAVVVGYTEGLGKYTGMVGGLVCKTIKSHDGPKEDIEIVIGSGLNDDLRNNPPKVDSIITYKFYDLTKNGIPRHAIYKGLYE